MLTHRPSGPGGLAGEPERGLGEPGNLGAWINSRLLAGPDGYLLLLLGPMEVLPNGRLGDN